MAENIEALVAKINTRVKQGPIKRKPGEITANDDGWWDKFWRGVKGEDTHTIEKDLNARDNDKKKDADVPPESVRITKRLHEMTDKDIEDLIKRHKFRETAAKDTDIGEQMLRRAVKREYINRGYDVQRF